jgi:hypothetical protein
VSDVHLSKRFADDPEGTVVRAAQAGGGDEGPGDPPTYELYPRADPGLQ